MACQKYQGQLSINTTDIVYLHNHPNFYTFHFIAFMLTRKILISAKAIVVLKIRHFVVLFACCASVNVYADWDSINPLKVIPNVIVQGVTGGAIGLQDGKLQPGVVSQGIGQIMEPVAGVLTSNATKKKNDRDRAEDQAKFANDIAAKTREVHQEKLNNVKNQIKLTNDFINDFPYFQKNNAIAQEQANSLLVYAEAHATHAKQAKTSMDMAIASNRQSSALLDQITAAIPANDNGIIFTEPGKAEETQRWTDARSKIQQLAKVAGSQTETFIASAIDASDFQSLTEFIKAISIVQGDLKGESKMLADLIEQKTQQKSDLEAQLEKLEKESP